MVEKAGIWEVLPKTKCIQLIFPPQDLDGLVVNMSSIEGLSTLIGRWAAIGFPALLHSLSGRCPWWDSSRIAEGKREGFLRLRSWATRLAITWLWVSDTLVGWDCTFLSHTTKLFNNLTTWSGIQQMGLPCKRRISRTLMQKQIETQMWKFGVCVEEKLWTEQYQGLNLDNSKLWVDSSADFLGNICEANRHSKAFISNIGRMECPDLVWEQWTVWIKILKHFYFQSNG